MLRGIAGWLAGWLLLVPAIAHLAARSHQPLRRPMSTITTTQTITGEKGTTTTTTTTTTATAAAFAAGTCPVCPPEDDAYAQCRCGKVIIRCIGQSEPGGGKAHLACGCCDCRAALKWCEKKGGPRCPEIVDGTYWPNDWDVMRGKEHLKCYLLREGMQSNRMVATCCHTCLLVDHPFYEEKVCLVLDGEADDPHRFKVMKNYKIPPLACRVFMRDASDEMKARHPASAVGVPPEKDYTGEEEHFLPEVTEHFNGFKDFTLTKEGQTFQELCAEVGQAYMNQTSEETALGSEYQQDFMQRVIVPMMEAGAEAEPEPEAAEKVD
jgi:hypothetical protein